MKWEILPELIYGLNPVYLFQKLKKETFNRPITRSVLYI